MLPIFESHISIAHIRGIGLVILTKYTQTIEL